MLLLSVCGMNETAVRACGVEISGGRHYKYHLSSLMAHGSLIDTTSDKLTDISHWSSEPATVNCDPGIVLMPTHTHTVKQTNTYTRGES